MNPSKAVDLLQNHHLKITPHRVAIIEALEKEHSPDIATLIKILEASGHKMDTVTIYRNLETLKAKGMVNQLDFGEGKSRFELSGPHHHHLICQSCGDVEVFDQGDVTQLETKIKHEHHFEVTHHTLEFFGRCHACQST
jgi:Fe2+ or Zn2+ uptake regulation protein